MADENGMDDVMQELQENLPAVSAWTYIAIWAIAEMIRRSQQNPSKPHFADITFPHTSVPLFTAEQAKKLEEVWPLSKQSGGGGIQQLSQGLTEVLNNPDTYSIDNKVSCLTNTINSLDEQITEFSKQNGLVALESVAPDPKFILPLGPIPIPIMMPARMVLPVFNAILEILRVSTTIFPTFEILGKPMTLIMVFLDLARGNLYHAIFSFLGMWGKNSMLIGIGLKVIRDAYMLVAPDLRSQLNETIYKSGKSMAVGWIIWLFGIVAPDIVRRPLASLLDKVRMLVDQFNNQMVAAEVQATAALKGFGSVSLPKIPSSQVPTVADLYILQQYVHNPHVYCHPEVAPLLAELRAIPPLALFFDLLSIPAVGSTAYMQACSTLPPLAASLKPTITPTPLAEPIMPTVPIPTIP